MSSQINELTQIVKAIDDRPENRLRAKTKVNHMNTSTTQNTMQITEQLQKQLGIIGQKIIKQLERNIPFYTIREKLNPEVTTLITVSVRESYLLGLRFIESFEKRAIPLTIKMIQEMNETTQNQVTAFWESVDNIILNNKAKSLKQVKQQLKARVAGAAGPFNSLLGRNFNNFFARSAVSLNFISLNQGTVTTQREIFRVKTNAGEISGSITVPQSIWVSERDGRVCPTCKNYDGMTWAVDDNSLPRPVQDTHFACRCRLLPVRDGKAFNA